MALTRAALIAAVAGEQVGVLALAGFTSADTTTNMKEVADNAFRALEVAEADLATASVADGDEQKAIAFLAYFTVDKAVSSTVAKMAVAAGSAKAALIEQHENLLRERGYRLGIAQFYGLPLPGNGQSGVIAIPYAGGMSLSDYERVATDGDRLPPLFGLSDIEIPGIPSLVGIDP